MTLPHPLLNHRRSLALALAGLLALSANHSLAADHGNVDAETQSHPPVTQTSAATAEAPVEPVAAKTSSGQDTLSRLKAVIERHSGKGGNVSLRVGGHVIAATHSDSIAPPPTEPTQVTDHKPRPAKAAPRVSQKSARARAAVLRGQAAPETLAPVDGEHLEAHWNHQGENGPQSWGQLKPEFNTCASGTRQSPVHILDADAMPGPAEVLAFDYHPSGGSVVNNGHTVQVDLAGNNTLHVRGSAYQLTQFHFHHPAEERVNGKGFSMVAHLVHQNEEGQLAIVAVLIDTGEENALVSQVWTHMPLDVNDRVDLPTGLIDLTQLLPVDQRYYQFFGSLTTPPCTEGVLWLVMKQPMTVSQEQLSLFAHIYPMNARPVQALNGRLIREAM